MANNKQILNALVSQPYNLPEGLKVHTIVKTSNIDEPKIMIALIIDENTTLTQVIKNFPAIVEFRKVLVSKIGSDPNVNYSDLLLFNLDQLHKQGMSWHSLSKLMNYKALASICCDFQERKSGILLSMGHLNLFIYSEVLLPADYDLEQLVRQANDDLENKNLPWDLLNGPFPARIIRDRVRYFEDRVNTGKLVVNEKWNETNSEDSSDAYFLVNGFYAQANSLLQKHKKDQWNQNKSWIMHHLIANSLLIETGPEEIYGDYRTVGKNTGKT